jgi:hypothetical protein
MTDLSKQSQTREARNPERKSKQINEPFTDIDRKKPVESASLAALQ